MGKPVTCCLDLSLERLLIAEPKLFGEVKLDTDAIAIALPDGVLLVQQE